MTVLSEHAQGTASLHDGSIDVWLDRTLDQDGGRGLKQGVQDNRLTRTRLRVLLERGGYDPASEFTVTPFSRRMWDELQHPLEMFGRHDAELVKTFHAEAKQRSEERQKLEAALMKSLSLQMLRSREMNARIRPPALRNDQQIRNVTITLHTLDNTTIPFVFVVYKRLDYLKSAIGLLRNSDFPRNRVPLIISHDGHVPDVVEYIEKIKNDFQLVQLSYPHACYDHNNTFPADDTRLNEGYKGDAYGNPRSPWATCCKHHYTWLFKTIFSREDFISKNIDTFLFLEEDYIVAPTVYQALVGGLNAMNEFEKETRRGFLGLSLDPTNGSSKKLPQITVPDACLVQSVLFQRSHDVAPFNICENTTQRGLLLRH